MTRSHATVLLLASLALVGYVAFWLWMLPRGMWPWDSNLGFIYLNLLISLLGALGLYAAVIVPAVLHALRSRWPFWAGVGVSMLFGLLSISPLIQGFTQASLTRQSRGRIVAHDALWEVLFWAGLLLLYLLAGICLLSWSLWNRPRVQQTAVADQQYDTRFITALR